MEKLLEALDELLNLAYGWCEMYGLNESDYAAIGEAAKQLEIHRTEKGEQP